MRFLYQLYIYIVSYLAWRDSLCFIIFHTHVECICRKSGTAGVEVQPIGRGLWTTGKVFRQPPLKLLLSIFSRESIDRSRSAPPPLTVKPSAKLFPNPPPSALAYNPETVTPCSVFVVSWGPFWPTFYYFKSESDALVFFWHWRNIPSVNTSGFEAAR